MLLSEHLKKFNLPEHQSALRADPSTETAPISIFDELLTTDSNDANAFLFLDLSATFDTVDHEILLGRLSHDFGLLSSALSRLSFYVSGRSQSVRVSDAMSQTSSLLRGVTILGSVLGGQLFVVYVAQTRSRSLFSMKSSRFLYMGIKDHYLANI